MARVHGSHFALGLLRGFIHFQFTPFSSDPCRQVFNTTFLEMVVLLDIQVPTLLMADFNGTVSPERDFSTPDNVRFVVCYHACCHPVVPFWTCSWWCPLRTSLSSFARPKRECCIFFITGQTLVLGNRAVLSLISRVFVASGKGMVGIFPCSLRSATSLPGLCRGGLLVLAFPTGCMPPPVISDPWTNGKVLFPQKCNIKRQSMEIKTLPCKTAHRRKRGEVQYAMNIVFVLDRCCRAPGALA